MKGVTSRLPPELSVQFIKRRMDNLIVYPRKYLSLFANHSPEEVVQRLLAVEVRHTDIVRICRNMALSRGLPEDHFLSKYEESGGGIVEWVVKGALDPEGLFPETGFWPLLVVRATAIPNYCYYVAGGGGHDQQQPPHKEHQKRKKKQEEEEAARKRRGPPLLLLSRRLVFILGIIIIPIQSSLELSPQ
jgi:hypothetical protein